MPNNFKKLGNEYTVLAGDLVSVTDSFVPSGNRLLRLYNVYAQDPKSDKGKQCITYLESFLTNPENINYIETWGITDRAVVYLTDYVNNIDINQMMRQYVEKLGREDQPDNTMEIGDDWTVLAGDLVSVPDPDVPSGIDLLRLNNVYAQDPTSDKGKQCITYLEKILAEYDQLGAIASFEIADRAVVYITNYSSIVDINQMMRDYIESLG